MILSLIAAIGRNNELGKKNTLLWHLPADLKHFKDKTSGHTVIMGRKTFESLPAGPLPNRKNIIITRDMAYLRHGVNVTHSLEEALKQAKGRPSEQKDEEEIFVIGGAEIYKQAIPFANRIYLTRVEIENRDADAFFPRIGEEWQEIFREEHFKDEKNPFDYTFLIYERK